jgi:arginine/lysine/ornithine decarboxylase
MSQAAMMHLGREAYRFEFPPQIGSGAEGGIGEVSKEADESEDSRTKEAGELLQECFSMLTTTSPNLVLLASLDATRAQMATEGQAMIQTAAAAADEIRYELRQQGLLRDEDTEEEEKVPGGVQLLDDSLSVGAARRHKKCTEEICVDSPQWLVDPLRLTVRFPGRSALDVDDGMCEGKSSRQRLIETVLLVVLCSSAAVRATFQYLLR